LECTFGLTSSNYLTPLRNFPYKVVEGLLERLIGYFVFLHYPLNKVIAKFLLGDIPFESFLC
jgi:hypothetical protein